MRIDRISKQEDVQVRELIWKTFLRFDAVDYSEEGVKDFYAYLMRDDLFERLIFLGAYEEDILIGVMAMCEGHISLFFVDEHYHRKGVGKALFQSMLRLQKQMIITVNSSLYAKEVYEHLGFRAINHESEAGGIRYIPMLYTKNGYLL